jgi:4-oxalocrotonate tautomerase
MPHLNVQISGQPDPQLSAKVARSLTTLTRDVLGKKPELTSVSVQYVAPEHWLIDNTPLSEQGLNAFNLEISITDETNTKQEKAEYLRQVYAALSELIGKVHEKSYIHVHDVRAASYGYGGRSQEYRYQHAG